MKNLKNGTTLKELEWDTNFFKVSSWKLTIHRALELQEWREVEKLIRVRQFVSIVNENCEPINAQYLGEETSAFLIDVNIQFEKIIQKSIILPKNISLHESLEKNDEIIKIAEFPYSKFTEDLELKKRNGNKVYQQWLLNSFEKENKFFALSKDDDNSINGFALFTYEKQTCVIELIAVSQNEIQKGIGRTLFNAVEHHAYLQKSRKIKVGTQIRNSKAINFYQRMGCKQVECHQIYHLWNGI